MSKYSLSFKQSVVNSYLGSTDGSKRVGDRFGIDHSTVRKWVASYEAHGSAGLSKKHGRYDAQFKLSVLRRIWEDGLSYRQAAALFDIRNASCLSEWERCYQTGGIEALTPRRSGRRRSMPDPLIPKPSPPTRSDEAKSREELLAELNYLRMENAFLKKLEALTREQQAPEKRKPSRR